MAHKAALMDDMDRNKAVEVGPAGHDEAQKAVVEENDNFDDVAANNYCDDVAEREEEARRDVAVVEQKNPTLAEAADQTGWAAEAGRVDPVGVFYKPYVCMYIYVCMYVYVVCVFCVSIYTSIRKNFLG